jgi:hypothetical protein
MDIAVWDIARAEKVPLFIFNHIGIACGMKQLSVYRQGIGAGHQPKEQGFTRDPMFDKLKEWIGDDAKNYQTWGRGK